MSNEAPGYQPPVTPPPPYTPAQKPARRVGVFTMGFSLIGAGVLAIYALINPAVDVLHLIRYTPAILILLGLEILAYAIFQRHSRLQYDFLSMFTCFVLIFGSLLIAAVPAAIENWGPGRGYTETRIENEIYDLCYESLNGSDEVTSLDVHVRLTNPELEKDMSYTSLVDADLVNVNVMLSKEYPSAEAFAASCRTLMNQLAKTGVQFDGLAFEADGKTRYELHLEGRYQLNMNAKELEALVDSYSDEEEGDEDTASSEVTSSAAETSSAAVSSTPSEAVSSDSTPSTPASSAGQAA